MVDYHQLPLVPAHRIAPPPHKACPMHGAPGSLPRSRISPIASAYSCFSTTPMTSGPLRSLFNIASPRASSLLHALFLPISLSTGVQAAFSRLSPPLTAPTLAPPHFIPSCARLAPRRTTGCLPPRLSRCSSTAWLSFHRWKMSPSSGDKKLEKSYLSSAVDSLNPFSGSRSATSTPDNSKRPPSLPASTTASPADHRISALYGQSFRTYPSDCPPLAVQWYHAVDVRNAFCLTSFL